MQKRSKDFDNIFKGKLKMIAPDANPGDWIMMERMLEWEGLSHDADDLDEMRFDEVAMDKLNNASNHGLTPDWDRMASMIDNIKEEPSMEPSEFDQAVKNKIQDGTVPLQMAIWEQMEPVLEADQERIISEMDFVTRDKLTQVTEVDGAWSQMNSKINRELFLPESIVKYKVIEVALVLLFAFSLWQMPFEQIQGGNNKLFTETRSSIIESDKLLPEITVNAPADLSSTLTNRSIGGEMPTTLGQSAIRQNLEVDAIPKSANQITDQELTEGYFTYNPILPPTLPELLKELSDWTGPRISTESVVQAIMGNGDAIPPFSFFDNISIGSKLTGTEIQSNTLSSTTNEEVNSFKGIEVISGQLSLLDLSDRSAIDDCILCPDNRNKLGLVLSVFTGSNFNQIVTPFDPIYAEEGTTQWNVGYGGGVALGMKFRNWELETGAIYATNQYQPRQIFDITGSFTSGYISSTLTDIKLNMVKIPLNFRFNVNLWDKWNIYALSGATINMVMASEYSTKEVFLGNKSFATPAAPAFSTSSLSLKDFEGGILEGGRFNNNSYFTANLGFGVERELNEKFSIFAQPTYQRQIFTNGIGPNQDRYNAVSLFLGLRTSLK